MQLDQLRTEIERMRTQVHRQRGEIRLQRAGKSTASAEALLERMLANIDGICAERDKLKKDRAAPPKAKSSGGEAAMSETRNADAVKSPAWHPAAPIST
jgi:hypothetical protein